MPHIDEDGRCSWCGPVECAEDHFTYCPLWHTCIDRDCPKHWPEDDDDRWPEDER